MSRRRGKDTNCHPPPPPPSVFFRFAPHLVVVHREVISLSTYPHSVSEELLLLLVSLMLLVGPIMRLIPHYPSRIRRVVRNNVFDTQTESRNKKRKVKSRCNPNFLPSFRPSVQLLSNYMCVNLQPRQQLQNISLTI